MSEMENSGPSSISDEKISKSLSTAKLKCTSPKKPKRKPISSGPSKKRKISYKKVKRQSKGLPKGEKNYIAYEYQIKSRLTWEYADIFSDISSWHDLSKADEADVQPIKIEPHHANKESVKNIPFRKSLIKNMGSRFDHQSKNVSPIDNKANTIGELPTTFHRIAMKDSIPPTHRCSGTVYPYNSSGAADETRLGPSDDKFDEETSGGINKSPVELPDKTVIAVASGAKKKSFQCRYCQKEFTSRPTLRVHMQIHSGKKPYLCTECLKTFSGSGDLTKHRRIHSGERPYKCTECPKMFSQSGNLTAHQRIHSGEKPYKCTESPTMFSQSCNLKVRFGELRPLDWLESIKLKTHGLLP